ncbi:MAG TPA: hypothetical protein VN784_11310 [Candidatus Limnocylindrales bacterium]|nr:hypothetical protein [Candidatus Limnocylindrales bacterium]
MKSKRFFVLGLVSLTLFQFVWSSPGFALLGPLASWMTTTNGFGPPQTTFADPFGDIGGPMDIGDGYRWNVPVITYGFDRSFLDYFGTNGVAAVEDAIQTLNDLPPASTVVLSNYPAQGPKINYTAQALNLYNLKSMTLALLLEQMGLAQPTRFVYVLRQFDPTVMYPNSPFLSSQFWGPGGVISNQIVLRNFDPETLVASIYVNDQLYTGILDITLWPNQTLNYAIPLSIPVNPLANGFAAADWLSIPSAGNFFDGLTRDDVGGLRYLLSPENISFETLLQSVHPVMRGWYDRRGHAFANGAWRPGIDKIAFVPQPVDSRGSRFLPATYDFKDLYLKNGRVTWQLVKRHLTRPDILFCAADTGENRSFTPFFVRTGTTNWLNNTVLNGNTNGEGPGVIQGPIKITFHKLGPAVVTGSFGTFFYNQSWGSFDVTTNLPVIYPSASDSDDSQQFTIRLRFFDTDFSPAVQLTNLTWHLSVPIGGQASLQISTNQSDWTSLATATNVGSVTEWYYDDSDNPPKYFRAIPQ